VSEPEPLFNEPVILLVDYPPLGRQVPAWCWTEDQMVTVGRSLQTAQREKGRGAGQHGVEVESHGA
jgi:hypothetical protein